MTTIQKLGVLVIGLAMITTATLSDRKTEQVINAGGNLITGVLATAMNVQRR